jgi:hypothetical protein
MLMMILLMAGDELVEDTDELTSSFAKITCERLRSSARA